MPRPLEQTKEVLEELGVQTGSGSGQCGRSRQLSPLVLDRAAALADAGNPSKTHTVLTSQLRALQTCLMLRPWQSSS
eukprot:2157362-Rhodomonas_salina.1